MDRFTTDNTEGFSRSALADLNAAYSVRMAEFRCHGVDVDAPEAQRLRDSQAARLLAEHARGAA